MLTKLCIVKAMVFPVVMYRCERFTMKKIEHQRTDAFKLWCWRRLFFFLVVLGLCLCVWAFSSCDEQGLLASWGPQASHCWWLLLLQTTASRVCGLSSCSSRALEHWFNSCGTCGLSCSTASELFPDQGSNPCLLHWQADSSPLSYQ